MTFIHCFCDFFLFIITQYNLLLYAPHLLFCCCCVLCVQSMFIGHIWKLSILISFVLLCNIIAKPQYGTVKGMNKLYGVSEMVNKNALFVPFRLLLLIKSNEFLCIFFRHKTAKKTYVKMHEFNAGQPNNRICSFSAESFFLSNLIYWKVACSDKQKALQSTNP